MTREWTEHEENLLVALYLNDFTCVQLSKIFGRSGSAIRSKYYNKLQKRTNSEVLLLAEDIRNQIQGWK